MLFAGELSLSMLAKQLQWYQKSACFICTNLLATYVVVQLNSTCCRLQAMNERTHWRHKLTNLTIKLERAHKLKCRTNPWTKHTQKSIRPGAATPTDCSCGCILYSWKKRSAAQGSCLTLLHYVRIMNDIY